MVLNIGGLVIALGQKPRNAGRDRYTGFTSVHTPRYAIVPTEFNGPPRVFLPIKKYHEIYSGLERQGTFLHAGSWPDDFFLRVIKKNTAEYGYRVGRKPARPKQFPFNQVLILGILHFLRGSGVFLHCFGGAYKGKGFAFIAHSQVGKTTLSRKWKSCRGITVLNDERCIIKKSGNRFDIFGTPWTGSLGRASNKQYPLQHVFVLVKGKSTRMRRLSAGEALHAMLSATYHMPWSVGYTRFYFSFMKRFLSRYRVYRVSREYVGEPKEFFKRLAALP